MKKINLIKGQWLQQVLPELPSKTILFKTLTGIGATTLELKSQRNSIIIEPNVPVILGKQSQMKGILGVSEGVYLEEIMDYLYSDILPKKILVTPESFYKVKDACSEVGLDIYKDFFLMYDECDRAIKDVSYRKGIILPMDDFFKFKKKIFISATPISPSDPRFEKQRFKELLINPTYDYRIHLDLIPTNNILLTLTKHFKTRKSESYFIFLNSTETIASIIRTLDITDETQVFCASESVQKLKYNGFRNANEHFDKNKIKKYNFFSSRFFSAVDIEVDQKPDLLIITDLHKASHSIIDPYTDSIQIVGRLRNGVNNVTHITNLNPHLESKSKEEVLSYLKGSREAYLQIKAFRMATTNEGARETLDQALKEVTYANFINSYDDSENSYMVDNEIHNNRINGYYHTSDTLLKGYEETNHFVILMDIDEYSLDDIKANKLEKGLSLQETIKVVTETLEEAKNPKYLYSFNKYTIEKNLQRTFPDIVNAFNLLGIEKIRDLNYKPSAIFKEIGLLELERDKDNFMFKSYLKMAFRYKKDGVPGKYINKVLAAGIKKHGLKLKASLKLFQIYFDISPRVKIGTSPAGKEIKGYYIKKCLFN